MFGLPFSLLNSQVISELLWKTKEEPHLQVALLRGCSSLTACLMVRLTKLCLAQGDVRKYSVESQNAPIFYDQGHKTQAFSFQKD